MSAQDLVSDIAYFYTEGDVNFPANQPLAECQMFGCLLCYVLEYWDVF